MNAKPKRQDRELALALIRTHCRELRIPDPQSEFHFSAERDWRFDFAWPDWKIAIEVEGGVFGVHDRFGRFYRGESGRHTRGAGFVRDLEKYNSAVADGWRLLRFTPAQMQRAEWREPVLKLLDSLRTLNQKGGPSEPPLGCVPWGIRNMSAFESILSAKCESAITGAPKD